MKPFTLELRDAERAERIDGVTSFVGEDASGSFGILGGHARFMTVLSFGMARFRCGADPWRYLAVPGAVLYFLEQRLFITTRRYLLGDDYALMDRMLRQRMRDEEEALHTTKERLRRMEEELVRRLWDTRRERHA